MSPWKPLGLIASGRLADSLLLRRPALARHLGPVAAAGPRLASRYANRLRAGHPARVEDLRGCGLIVLHGGAGGVERILALLRAAGSWRGACFALLSADLDSGALDELRAGGARVCSVAPAPDAARDLIVVEGDRSAVRRAREWLADAHLRCLELAPGGKPLFLLGVQTPSCLLVPVLDAAFQALKASGLSPAEARWMLRFLGETAVREFVAHGRRSWLDPDAPARAGTMAKAVADLAHNNPRLARFQRALLDAVARFYGPEQDEELPAKDSRVLRVRLSIP
ncbi:MAG: hypothetical protein NZR01_08480 [Bryobacteraceae bacterium]|nr:hypothetical protein [Bryobacteraceae bacterium]